MVGCGGARHDLERKEAIAMTAVVRVPMEWAAFK
jgi:hypothetical protein